MEKTRALIKSLDSLGNEHQTDIAVSRQKITSLATRSYFRCFSKLGSRGCRLTRRIASRLRRVVAR